MKVAIVHDWLYGGGAEQVILEMHKMFPDAPIYTSYCSDEWRRKLDGRVVTGYLQHAPFRQLRKFLPVLRHYWFRSLDLAEYDLVISSSGNGEAKAIRRGPGKKHISYSHSVNQFYWRHYDEFIKNPGQRPYWLMRLGLRLFLNPMKKRDFDAAQDVDYFIANSTFVQNEIKEHYQRDSTVIFPPVRVAVHERLRGKKVDGFVTMSRLVPWKRVDIIVAACTKLGVPLAVIGDGPEKQRLTKLAGPNVTFLGWIEGDSRLDYIAQSNAFILASLEPFGIAPIEAMAAGTPVIAYKAGGALDYVVPGKTGEFFAEQTVESLAQALQKFDSSTYDARAIRYHAARFSEESFAKSMRKFLKEHQFYM